MSERPELPAPVRALVEAFLREVDAARPGLVEGLYLVGSVALGDFQPHQSDVDYVAVVRSPLGAEDIEALKRAHAALPRCPSFEGMHLSWSALADDPARCPPVPTTDVDGFDPAGRGEVHPVTWHELAWHGLALRGPPRPEVWVDPEALAAFTRRNLETYWRSWVRGRGQQLAASPRGASWGVLGVSRLHHLLATGRMTSKTGAGLYAREAFSPRWRPIVEECLRERMAAGQPTMDASTRCRWALDFIEEVIQGVP